MTKWLISAVAVSAVLGGCTSVPRGSIPVVESGASVYGQQQGSVTGRSEGAVQPQSVPEDSGVVVMVPGAAGSSAPIQTYPAPSVPSAPIAGAIGGESPGSERTTGEPSYSAPPASMPNGIPSGGGLAADEQLEGPVLALLTTAQQQQGSGDLNGAASSLERAQRIAPREPQVLYRLAEVRLAQGDAAQAEQFARRALSYASGRPALQASLWNLIAQARERQGDPAGAAQARERARVNL